MVMRQVQRLLAVAVVAAGLGMAAGCGCGKVLRKADATTVEWFLVIDASYSVPPQALERYKTELARDSVLCRLRPGETVHVMVMDSDPYDDVRAFPIAQGSPRDVLKQELDIYQHVKSIKRRPQTERGTNFGEAINYLKEKIAYAEETRQKRMKTGEQPPSLPTYVMVMLTDGVAEGWQVEGVGGLPKNVEVRIWFCGISPWSENDPQAKKLRTLLSKDYPNLKGRQLKDLVECSLRDHCRKLGLADVNVRPYAHSDWVQDFLADLHRDQDAATLKGLTAGHLVEEGY